MSNLAWSEHMKRCCNSKGTVEHGWECKVLQQIHAELGDEKFTRRHSPGKLQVVKVSRKFAPGQLEIVHSVDNNCDFVQTRHAVWLAGSVAPAPEPKDGPAAKKMKPGALTRKVAVNTYSDEGGAFRLSTKALAVYEEVCKKSKKPLPDMTLLRNGEIRRDNPLLIAVIEKLGSAASGFRSNIQLVEIPGNVKWELKCDDGIEWIAEEHREWWPDRAGL